MAFHNLRNVIPTLPSDRTTIKATLRLAIKYIMFLEYVLENNLYCNDFHHEFYQWRETFGKQSLKLLTQSKCATNCNLHVNDTSDFKEICMPFHLIKTSFFSLKSSADDVGIC